MSTPASQARPAHPARPAFDHDRLHGAARSSAVGGLVAGGLAYLTAELMGGAAGAAVLLVGAASVCAGALAAAAPRGNRAHVLVAVATTLIAGAIAREHAVGYAFFGTLVLGGALGMAPGWRLPLPRAALSVGFGVVVVGLAWAATAPLIGSPLLSWMPPWAALPAAGAGLGFGMSFAIVPRLLGAPYDRVAEALEALESRGGGTTPTVRDLARRAAKAHAATRSALADSPPEDRSLADDVAAASEDLALSVMSVASRWADVESALDLADCDDPERLAARLDDLGARAQATDDPVAKAGYERAREQVRTLMTHHERLAAGRERLTARLHQQVATLESLRLSCLHLRSADAQRFACEVSPLLDTANALSEDAADLASVSDSLMAMT